MARTRPKPTRCSRSSWARRSRRARTSSRPRPGRSGTLTSELDVRRGRLRRVDGSAERARRVEPPPEPAAGLAVEVEPHHCFACGSLNEHGLHLDLHVDRDRCWTQIALPDRFQGWDGIAHGGIVCTVLDEVMAWSLASTDNWGVTARLAVAFRKPVPIGKPIRAEGWVTSARRRLVETSATIRDEGGTLLAT